MAGKRTYEIRCPLYGFVELDDWERERQKRLHLKIVRRSAKKGTVSKETKSLYSQLIPLTERLLARVGADRV